MPTAVRPPALPTRPALPPAARCVSRASASVCTLTQGRCRCVRASPFCHGRAMGAPGGGAGGWRDKAAGGSPHSDPMMRKEAPGMGSWDRGAGGNADWGPSGGRGRAPGGRRAGLACAQVQQRRCAARGRHKRAQTREQEATRRGARSQRRASAPWGARRGRPASELGCGASGASRAGARGTHVRRNRTVMRSRACTEAESSKRRAPPPPRPLEPGRPGRGPGRGLRQPPRGGTRMRVEPAAAGAPRRAARALAGSAAPSKRCCHMMS